MSNKFSFSLDGADLNTNNLCKLPDSLPIPVDDGECDHFLEESILRNDVYLHNMNGEKISWNKVIENNNIVMFIYPMMGMPGHTLPNGWDLVPGARGCTPQACKYRDNLSLILSSGYKVIGLSNQQYTSQKELSIIHNLNYPLFSDEAMQLKTQLNIPTFFHNNKEYYKRVTLIIENGIVKKFFYPIFPPGSDVELAIQYLQQI